MATVYKVYYPYCLVKSEWYPNPGDYLKTVKKAFALTANGGTVKQFWHSAPMDAVGWRREFVKALHRRINIKGGIGPYGRKSDDEYRKAALRDQRSLEAILSRRIRVYQFETKEVNERFGHLLAHYDD